MPANHRVGGKRMLSVRRNAFEVVGTTQVAVDGFEVVAHA